MNRWAARVAGRREVEWERNRGGGEQVGKQGVCYGRCENECEGWPCDSAPGISLD